VQRNFGPDARPVMRFAHGWDAGRAVGGRTLVGYPLGIVTTLITTKGFMDIGYLIIRLVIGTTLAVHGAQKLFGLFGGYGLAGTGGYFESIGFRPGKPLAFIAGIGETLGGLLLAVGLFTPFASAVLLSTMVVAIAVHADKGFFAQSGGYEYPLILATAVAAIAFTGSGALSLDALLGNAFAGATWGVTALALGALGAIPPLALRATNRARAAATA